MLARWLPLSLTMLLPAVGVRAEPPERATANRATNAELGHSLDTLKHAAARDGNQAELAAAWRELVAADVKGLPAILAAIDDAAPLAANWIAAAAQAVAERAAQPGIQLPRAELEVFLNDRRHAQRARRLAYEILLPGDATLADRVLPTMLDDPSLELRRDAVARVLAEADRLADAQPAVRARALAQYQTVLNSARDTDQIKRAVEQLRRFGQAVDLARHFGFIQSWKIVGPLDNRGGRGYAALLPPEEKLDFAAQYPGVGGQVGWRDYTTHDDYGQVDLNAALGRQLEVLGYAATEFQAAAAQEVEFRVGSENAIRVWLNGRLLVESPAYHSLAAMDQFVGRGSLHTGRNLILVKVCQNNQTEDWARAWQFQLRVCDATGKAILSTDRPPASEEAKP